MATPRAACHQTPWGAAPRHHAPLPVGPLKAVVAERRTCTALGLGSARIVVRTNKKDGRVLPGAGRGCTLFWPSSVVKVSVRARRRGVQRRSTRPDDALEATPFARSVGSTKLLRGFCDSPTYPESTLGPCEERRGPVARQSEKRKKLAH